MSGPEPPPSEARVSSSNHRAFPLKYIAENLKNVTLKRSPAGSDPVTPNTFTEKATSSFGIPFQKEFLSMPSLHSGCHPAAKVQLMRIPSIQNNPESSRQPQTHKTYSVPGKTTTVKHNSASNTKELPTYKELKSQKRDRSPNPYTFKT